MSRRRWIAGLTSLALVAALSGPLRAQDLPAPDAPVAWLSTGDSYSSGEGVFGNQGDCAQSSGAWGPLAVDKLSTQPGETAWTIAPEAFTACTGLLVEHFFNAGQPDKDSLYQWGLEQGVPERVDVMTMSFGGNDIGFGVILSDCVILPDSWVGAIAFGLLSGASGCDISELEVQERIDALMAPPVTECSGGRAINVVDEEPYLCDLMIHPDGQRGTYVDFLVRVVEHHLTPAGRLYLAGYPALFAPTNEWPGWSYAMCAYVKRGDTEKLGRLASYFEAKLRVAVGQANTRLGADRITYVSRHEVFRAGNHELCGPGEDWLNGLTANRGVGPNFRPAGSYHPNLAGHTGTADALLDAMNQVDWTLLDQVRSVRWETIVDGEDPVDIDVAYITTGIASIDDSIRGSAEEAVARSRELLASVQASDPGNPSIELLLRLTYAPTFISKELVSIHQFGFSAYGGSPSQGSVAHVFDGAGQELIVADQLSPEAWDVMQPVVEAYRLEVAAEAERRTGVSSARFTADWEENVDLDRSLLVTPDGVRLLIGAGVIDANAGGTPTFDFAWSEIAPFIVPGSRLESVAEGRLVSLPLPPRA